MLFSEAGTQLVGHEGYVAYLLDQPVTETWDGGSMTYSEWTSTSSAELVTHYVKARAQCECGWTGHAVPASRDCLEQAEEDALMEEWYSEHANPLLRLQAVTQADEDVRDAEGRRVSAIAVAREQGASWSDIGSALGVSKQAAQQRYS
jgi:hypothetical protein